MKYVVFVARLVLGGLFIYASIHKIIDPGSFAQSVRNYLILPPEWTNIVAITLPWIELTVGLFLVLGFQTKPSALIVSGLMCVFIAALSYAYYIGLDINCGCFSSSDSAGGKITILTLLRDSMLLPVALFVLFADRGELSVSGLAPRREEPSVGRSGFRT